MNWEESRRSLFQKLLLVSLIVALMLAMLPVQGALAAPASADSINGDLAKEWKDKIEHLQAFGLFYERVRVYPADFDDPAVHAQAWNILHRYGAALRAAQTVVLSRTGFDEKGRVINEKQADQSLKELAGYLHEMRSLRKNLDALEGEYRLLPISVVRSQSASQ
jgi:hypothetical protein